MLSKLFRCFAACGLLALLSTLLAATVQTKPWGVPDVRREEYEDKLAAAHQAVIERNDVVALEKSAWRLDRRSHHFNVTQQTQLPLKTSFCISNTGETQVMLQCRDADDDLCSVSLETSSVQPGQSAQISVQWSPTLQPDATMSKQIVINATNQTLSKDITLNLNCRGESGYHIDPTMKLQRARFANESVVGTSLVTSRFFTDLAVLEHNTSNNAIDIAVSPLTPEMIDREGLDAVSALMIKATLLPGRTGKQFDERIRVRVGDPQSGQSKWLETSLTGSYKSAVSFFGPEIRVGSGLELGTVELNDSKTWSFGVRFRTTDLVNDAYIKAIQPESLTAVIEPSQRLPNTYRVTLGLAKDAQPTRFHTDGQGFVEIASASDPSLSKWMPLQGEIIAPIVP
ncbi:MAG: DUF1573 domain-containing protein [Planctomycetota bacterium]